MSQKQYNILLNNLLREKHALAKLRVELERRKGKLYRAAKGSDTWSKTAEIKERGKREQKCLKINLKF